MATNYNIDYNDARFQQVTNEEATAKREADNMYNQMINNSNGYYQEMIDASKDYANTQQKIQQDNTNFAIEQINQQKAQAEQDYTKEQKGAYTDYQKASNQYGANAESMAQQGMANTGYSESSQVSMYNTYQNRYATARDSYNRAVLNYDNAIKDAQLKNNSALAEIAYNALQTQLQLSLEGFQYKNTLLQQKLATQREISSEYYGRWQNVLNQINTENSMKEQIRQYNESMAEQRRQYNETLAFQKSESAREQSNWEKTYALQKDSSSGSSSIKKSSGSSGIKKSENSSSKSSSSTVKKSNSKSSNAVATIKKTIEETSKMPLLSEKTVARQVLAKAYRDGDITESQFKMLASEYKIN